LITKLLFAISFFGLFTSTIYTALVLMGVKDYLRSRRRRKNKFFAPPVSLLKPLHGFEQHLEEHLEGFFQQEYSKFEILFSARYEEDEGLLIARRVAERYPHIPVQFLTTGEPRYINAKVGSLERMASVAKNDILIVSDSDVRVSPDYISSVVEPFQDTSVGLVTCPYRGVAADGGFWARLEAVGMSVEMTSGVLVARMMDGMRFALGPTMAVRRECVKKIGGFGVLGSYCADDFVLGQLVAERGYKIVFGDHVIDHMILNSEFSASMKHQVRWMKSTRFSRPKGHFGTALTFSLPFGLLGGLTGLLAGYPKLAVGCLAWSVLTRIAMAVLVGGAALEDRPIWRLAMLYPLRDLMGFCFWAASYANNKILWRGEVYELGAGGFMRSTKAEEENKREPALTA
jgi:ceramide glucosyltransferase